jgi:hypothetical protein
MATASLIGMGVAIAGALVALVWLPARATASAAPSTAPATPATLFAPEIVPDPTPASVAVAGPVKVQPAVG